MKITLTLNGKKLNGEIAPDETLLNFLRKSGVLSVRMGCDTTNCGLCTVWVDELPTLSCAYLAARADGKRVVTLEGVEKEAGEFSKFLASEGADQCGYCSPGFIMTVLAMKKDMENPTKEKINDYLKGNLCRCTGYMAQMRALCKYMGVE